MPHILAIDQGTSSSRAIVFDDGRVVATGQRSFDQSFPADGWVEQDPEALWRTTLGAAEDALAAAGIEARQVAAIGIANQRETTVLWDAETGAAVHPAIGWQDRRTAERCAAMAREGVAEGIRDVTGLLVDPYFSSTKLAWLLDQGDLRRRAAAGELRFGTVDAFLIWRLTGGQRHCTDATNASRTQLYDIAGHAWSDTLLDYFDVPVAVLPEVKDSVADFGVCQARWLVAENPPNRRPAGGRRRGQRGRGSLAHQRRHGRDRLVPPVLGGCGGCQGRTRRIARGHRDLRSPPRSPQLNGIVERASRGGYLTQCPKGH